MDRWAVPLRSSFLLLPLLLQTPPPPSAHIQSPLLFTAPPSADSSLTCPLGWVTFSFLLTLWLSHRPSSVLLPILSPFLFPHPQQHACLSLRLPQICSHVIHLYQSFFFARLAATAWCLAVCWMKQHWIILREEMDSEAGTPDMKWTVVQEQQKRKRMRPVFSGMRL